ncbi:tRNA (adenosine(37)-N6)-threonylcarbamoyltransferase complex ATPase subunit type 1 TsaE [Skermania piniformis]|uniref:tRNA threonylcarbamoyladenosine biosynthesis protein TsaE n=1 Tax=Skermania pinensis TaxID=39122 RepID=A0ABX8SA39_9ACTN|nr:tRNA (adenosine(37)-N6)-threonylcarbamoyltransferase complex ATPase subunit type 1 TsaE [Skermania piniformis]QXQ14638.1 tRNA (adenosine(37)-N6)-threonylcarbamoyltransferase complex ATPase subunit type 1 TsaE [Skermania piniformis]
MNEPDHPEKPGHPEEHGTEERGAVLRLPTTADTEAFGRTLAAGLRAGDLVILDGPLGAGKTALTRGIAAGLGVTGRVSSPTFVIARTHRARPGGIGLVHVDAYRLDPASGTGVLDELDALDLDTELTDAVVVVEWGVGVAERLADRYLLVRLRREPDSDVRTAAWEWVAR